MWTTGAAVRRYDIWGGDGEYDEVLSLEPSAVRLDRLNAGAPLLDTHCSYQLSNVIGVIVDGSAKIEDGRGVATVLLSKAKGVADTTQKIREGVIKNISVGYWIHKVEKTESDDDKIARWDVVDWEPLEVSAVPIPADPGAQFRSEKRTDETEQSLRSCVIVTRNKPAAGPKQKVRLTMHKAASKRTAKTAEQEAEAKRLAALRASKRDEDKKDEKEDEDKDERDNEDDADGEMAADEGESKDKDADEENAADDDSDNDADDDSDNEDDGQSDDKRAAPGKRLTAAEVRRAAEAAVRADRVRGADIRKIGAQFGLPKLAEKHANGETSVKRFKDIVLERLADRQNKRGNTTFSASGSQDLDESLRAAPAAAARDFDKGAAEARALLGLKK